MTLREVLEHPLAADAGVRVLAGRRGRRRVFRRAAAPGRHERVHAGGREGDDPRAGEGFGDERRDVDVHRPGEMLGAGRAELAPGHEHDVRELRQPRERVAVEEIGRDAFDAVTSERIAYARLREARHGDDASARRRALGEPRERRPHLAAGAEHDDVARRAPEIGDQRRRGRGHHVLEVLDALESVGQGHWTTLALKRSGFALGAARRAHLRGTPCRQACRCSPTLTIFIVFVPPDLPIGSPNESTIRSPACTTPFSTSTRSASASSASRSWPW